MTNGLRCQVCTSSALELLEEYTTLPRVTTDAKPWPAGGKLSVCNSCGAIQKLPDEEWLDEIRNIYAAYDMYHLSNGAEQLIFAGPNNIKPRSKRLVDFVMQQAGLPDHGDLLDIGCGNGDALKCFSQALPGWKLNGCEITDKSVSTLQKLPNFSTLYTAPLAQLQKRFTMISMIHSLEQMTAPGAALTDTAALLDLGGTLFVEVPDIETSPFDLLVADSLMHFSRATLSHLVTRCGFKVNMLINDLLPKEITLLARRGDATVTVSDPSAGIRISHMTLHWLVDVFTRARSLAAKGEIGIFGTSIAAMALYGDLRERVAFFVDEDPARIGKIYDGRRVLAPHDAPHEIPVLIALPTRLGHIVETRLASTGMNSVCMPEFSPF
jgi:trans-aconitate methyltransferase